MPGVDINGTPICVDTWKAHAFPSKRIFFLTHVHSDHTKGLTSTWKHPIYCSEITAKLIHHMKDVPKKYLKTLAVGQEHVLKLDSSGKSTFTVKFIDANHCPGAVMILMQGYFGCILATGDFRYKAQMIKEIGLGEGDIDTIYLDNTYNHAAYKKFPLVEDVVEQAVKIVKEHDSDVCIGDYRVGKEILLQEIASQCQERILVAPDRLKTLKVLGLPDLFTDDPSASRIHSVSLAYLHKKAKQLYKESGDIQVLIPSGRADQVAMQVKQSGIPANRIHKLYYTEHSSFTELTEFIRRLKPKKIIPIVTQDSRVKQGIDVTDVSHFDKYLDGRAVSSFTMPEISSGPVVKPGGAPPPPPPKRQRRVKLGAVFDSPQSDRTFSPRTRRTMAPRALRSTPPEIDKPTVMLTKIPRHAMYAAGTAGTIQVEHWFKNSDDGKSISPEKMSKREQALPSMERPNMEKNQPILVPKNHDERISILEAEQPLPVSEADVEYFDTNSTLIAADQQEIFCDSLEYLTNCSEPLHTATESGWVVTTCVRELINRYDNILGVGIPIVLLPGHMLKNAARISKSQKECPVCSGLKHGFRPYAEKKPSLYTQLQKLLDHAGKTSCIDVSILKPDLQHRHTRLQHNISKDPKKDIPKLSSELKPKEKDLMSSPRKRKRLCSPEDYMINTPVAPTAK